MQRHLTTTTPDITQAAQLFDSLDVTEGTRLDYKWRTKQFVG